MKKTLFIILIASLALVSCEKFLDHMPDNRTEIDTEDKVVSLLTSAYPTVAYILISEMMSDNQDDYIISYKNTDRFYDQLFAWEDATEDDNESPEALWNASYHAIATANQALDAIDKLGGPEKSVTLAQARAEALLCRAYNHFILVNIFCKNYNAQTASDDTGIPYMEECETELAPKYDRGTVADDYEKIERDIREALEICGDNNYLIPKYHFNQKAAYAFATRFFLYYEKWNDAINCANRCLGSEPRTMLRDWGAMSGLSFEPDVIWNAYIQSDSKANLLLMAPYSNVGVVFGPYSSCTRYSHGKCIANNEDYDADQLWGNADYKLRVATYIGALDRVIQWKIPYKFEYTDAVAGIGYRHIVYPAFWTDECLLNRAEAYVMTDQYDKAAADISMWIQNMTTYSSDFTANEISSFYESKNYFTWDRPTIKKHLNPSFEIGPEKAMKENMLQCVLGLRRIETVGQGLRWFDVKRYGIEIERRRMGADGYPARVTDILKKDDPRRAVQIPLKVRSAGMEPNPRNN